MTTYIWENIELYIKISKFIACKLYRNKSEFLI